MTAALVHLTGSGMRSRCRAVGVRVLTALALVLPIPIFALLGLSLPLPASVERLAAQLVPFGDVEAAVVGASGTIILSSADQSSPRTSSQANVSFAPVTRTAKLRAAAIDAPPAVTPGVERPNAPVSPDGASPAGAADRPPTAPDSSTTAPDSPTTAASNTETPSTAPAPTPPPTVTQPDEGSKPAEPSLVDTTVNTATTAVNETVKPAVDTAKGVVETTEGIAKGALP